MANKPEQGNRLIIAGKLLLIAGFLLVMVSRFLPKTFLADTLGGFVWFVLPVPTLMILAGSMLYWRGRQHRDKAKAATVIGDSVPDVLYLRTFNTDSSTFGYVFSSLFTTTLYAGMATVEEQLGEVLQPFGDFVAIGRPGEKLPTPGAARLYASDAGWKDVVKAQMDAASLVVIRAGATEGLLWEVEQAARLANPRRLLILVLGMKRKHYASFKALADSVFFSPLPAADKFPSFIGRLTGFIWFDADWKPTVLSLRPSVFRRSPYKSARWRFKFALKPVFDEYGLEWKAPPISAWTVSAAALLAVTSVPVWKRVAVKEISFAAPEDLAFRVVSTNELPPIKTDALEYLEIYDTGLIVDRRLSVSRFASKPGAKVSLDGALKGAITAMAGPMADGQFKQGFRTGVEQSGVQHFCFFDSAESCCAPTVRFARFTRGKSDSSDCRGNGRSAGNSS